MPQPYLLPGSFSSPRRGTNIALLFVLVFLAAFAGGGYLIWQSLAVSHTSKPALRIVRKTQTIPASAKNLMLEDLYIHLQNAIRSTSHSSELMRQSQHRIRAVVPAMKRNYLYLEQKRLEAADALATRAIRESARASEELDVAQKLTQQKLTEGDSQ